MGYEFEFSDEKASREAVLDLNNACKLMKEKWLRLVEEKKITDLSIVEQETENAFRRPFHSAKENAFRRPIHYAKKHSGGVLH